MRAVELEAQGNFLEERRGVHRMQIPNSVRVLVTVTGTENPMHAWKVCDSPPLFPFQEKLGRG